MFLILSCHLFAFPNREYVGVSGIIARNSAKIMSRAGVSPQDDTFGFIYSFFLSVHTWLIIISAWCEIGCAHGLTSAAQWVVRLPASPRDRNPLPHIIQWHGWTPAGDHPPFRPSHRFRHLARGAATRRGYIVIIVTSAPVLIPLRPHLLVNMSPGNPEFSPSYCVHTPVLTTEAPIPSQWWITH